MELDGRLTVDCKKPWTPLEMEPDLVDGEGPAKALVKGFMNGQGENKHDMPRLTGRRQEDWNLDPGSDIDTEQWLRICLQRRSPQFKS